MNAARLRTSLRFRRIIEYIEPDNAEVMKAKLHLSQIQKRLGAGFEVVRTAQVGSHWKGTAIRYASDVDLLVVMSRDEVRKWNPEGKSDGILRRVRNDLHTRYPSSVVRRDGQAVVINFGAGAYAVDVVPALFEAFASSPRFAIPDGAGRWITTSPESQRQFLAAANARSGNKLISLIRLLKWWAFSRDSTSFVRSMYVEYFAASARLAVGATYQEALCRLLHELKGVGGRPIPDPVTRGGAVDLGGTRRQLSDFLPVLELSAARALKAVDAETRNDYTEAAKQWNLVFNNQLPE